MSGSNNGPFDPHTGPPPGMRLDHDPFTQPAHRTGAPPQPRPPAPGSGGQMRAPHAHELQGQGLQAPARKAKADRGDNSGESIVPAKSVTGSSLTLVIAIMCFLAGLTAGAVYLMNQSADAWLHNIASEVTIQVEPRRNADTRRVIKEVTSMLRRTGGINKIKVLSLEHSRKMLEPWIGSSAILETLPVPRLIALELNRRSPPDFTILRRRLKNGFTGVSLDDHRQYRKEIKTATRSFALAGIAILLLVAAATTAIIVSATRAAMASNKDIVEVLDYVGAADKFIAKQFARHFRQLGVKAGLIGAGLAMLVFYLMPAILSLLGGGDVTTTEFKRLIGTGTLDVPGYFLLLCLIAIVAFLCSLTSRWEVYRFLNARH